MELGYEGERSGEGLILFEGIMAPADLCLVVWQLDFKLGYP